MFMKNILKIPDPKRRFLEDPYKLLKDIIRNYLLRIPFQGITPFGRTKITERWRRPLLSLDNIISYSVSGRGGYCSHNNYFLRLQLESIGYEVTTISGCFRRTGVEDTHNLNLVKFKPRGKSEPKSFLVDVGGGVPIHEPIPLFELPYRSRAGGLNYRYEQTEELKMQRVNEMGDAIMGPREKGYLSPQDYTINLKSMELENFITLSRLFYEHPEVIYPPVGTFCFRYLDIDENDFQCVCIRGLDVVLFTKETRTVQSFKDYNELRQSFYKYFPMIPKEEVDQAVENYSAQPLLNVDLRKLKFKKNSK